MSSCVRPSVTSRHCIKTAKPIGSRKQRRRIAQGLYFPMLKNLGKIPNRGVVGENRRFSTYISLCLRNDARQSTT